MEGVLSALLDEIAEEIDGGRARAVVVLDDIEGLTYVLVWV